MNERFRGIVKWFNNPQGYGFITCDEHKDDIFVHYRNIHGDSFRSLSEGQPVEFATQKGEKGLQAHDVVCL
ncbi:cold shock domain-containing protein [Proteobacteria bacterium 005FR1]|nr:cold shock domain-containing protein [Proteobacteria bacterium 005FR1]